MPKPTPLLRSAGVLVLGAALVSGVAGYVVLILAARSLSPAANAQFLVFWGLLFSVYGVLVGISTETTRAVSAGRGSTDGARVMPTMLIVALAVTLTLAASGLAWAPALLGSSWPSLLGATSVGVSLFGVHAVVAGAASGAGAWRGYSLLVAAETMTRVVLCGAVALASAEVVGFAWATAVASGAWMALTIASQRYRALWRVHADVEVRGLLRRVVMACGASGVSALLLVGYPVMLRMTTSDEVFATAAPLVLAVSLSRAPLLVPLGAYQNVVVTKVVLQGPLALLPIVTALGIVTAAGAAAAWAAGPWVLRVVNPAYHVSAEVFGALMLAAGLVALLTLTGAAAVAMDHHVVYLGGWITATLVAFVVLMAPWSLEGRVIASLIAGPIAGTAVHLIFGRRRVH